MRAYNKNKLTKKEIWLFLWLAKKKKVMKKILGKMIRKQAHQNRMNFGKILTHFIAFQTQILQTNVKKIHFSSFVLIMLF